jgi:PadR family transcriptional regulator, regulatory protein PadR
MSRLPLRPTAVAVLQALTAGARHGFDVINATGLASGTVYPALARLEHDGLVESRWEEHRLAQREKRPPRRYYEVTRTGERMLHTAAAALQERERAARAHMRSLRPIRAKG